MKRLALIAFTLITLVCAVCAFNCGLYTPGTVLFVIAGIFMLVKPDDHKPMRKNSIKLNDVSFDDEGRPEPSYVDQ